MTYPYLKTKFKSTVPPGAGANLRSRRRGAAAAATKFKFSSVPIFRYAARAGGADFTKYYQNYYYGAYFIKP